MILALQEKTKTGQTRIKHEVDTVSCLDRPSKEIGANQQGTNITKIKL